MGPKVVSWHFNWRFWVPKECQGGPVFFGWWAKVAGEVERWRDGVLVDVHDEWEMSAFQVGVKRDMGFIQ